LKAPLRRLINAYNNLCYTISSMNPLQPEGIRRESRRFLITSLKKIVYEENEIRNISLPVSTFLFLLLPKCHWLLLELISWRNPFRVLKFRVPLLLLSHNWPLKDIALLFLYLFPIQIVHRIAFFFRNLYEK